MPDLRDQFRRPLRDLRVSVTDRCNFRCPYCMPAEVFGADYPFLQDAQLMSLAELARILRQFVRAGVEKVRVTGGEPLLRPEVPELIRLLKQELRVPDVALTTNGWLLERTAPALRAAGLDRLNVSLDSLDPETFARMSGRQRRIEGVLAGIAAATGLGLPVKINTVVQRGVNDGELLRLAAWAREQSLTLRFIEYMDVGNYNHWRRELVVPAREIVEQIGAAWPLEPCVPAYRGEVAARYRYRDGRGEIGLISSVTEPFCRDCHRARLSADGKLYTCLFATAGWDLRGALRAGASDDELFAFVGRVWAGRLDRYSDERAELLARHESRHKIEMSYIGG
ncbi:MAG: cyclic pyranopterin phosphate synthase [Verrucomicrobia bacterium RIFCSPLOWO2_12_FULL_64_8]|nr:MAG: cyclic pyranopterin phosphate synthase [Verrucomicrobia bacterium RIFCSPLOWO2_12_FULL_64_8]